MNVGPVKEGLQNKWDSSDCLQAPLSQKTTYILNSDQMLHGADCDIKDDKDSICYKVKGNAFNLASEYWMTILDPSGNPVCVLKAVDRKRRFYHIYKFEPNEEGQKSTEEADGRPLYRFAWMKLRCCTWNTVDYGLYKGND